MARVFTDAGAMKLISAVQRFTNDGAFSVSFWIFRTATPLAQRSILTASDVSVSVGWALSLTTANLIQASYPFTTTDKVRNSSTATTLNGWMHVLVTHENTGLANTDFTFYMNGKSEAGTAVTTGSGTHDTATATAIEVGSSTAQVQSAPPASIGPFAIWNRALSPAEALALATGQHPLRFMPGLIEFFDLNTAHGEEGKVQSIYLVQGATNPTSATVSPPVENWPLLIPQA